VLIHSSPQLENGRTKLTKQLEWPTKTKPTYITTKVIIKVEDFHRVTLLGVFVILKGHVKKDYLMWKRILKEENKEENKDCKPKVRMNMVTIDFHQQE
jgi:hypothetical protein